MALLTSVILGWNGSADTNALAYLASSSVTKQKSFITLAEDRQE